MPVTASGYPKPRTTVTMASIAMQADACLTRPDRRISVESDRGEGQVDELDEDERGDDPADAVDEGVAPQDRGPVAGLERHPAQRQRDQRRDDERVVDDRGQDRRVRAVQAR